MATINDKQYNTATWLAAKVREATPGQAALWNLEGAVGAGKSSVLRKVHDLLKGDGLIPILVSAPGDQADSAPIALLEATDQLKGNLTNGEVAVICDIRRSWPDKLEALARVVERNASSVVLLCDEPTRWYDQDEAILDNTPDYAARSLAEWIAQSATCRRVVSGSLPGVATPLEKTRAPRLDDAGEFLSAEEEWGGFASAAAELAGTLPMPLAHSSVLQVRLLVALTRFKSTSEVVRQAVSEMSAKALLEEFLDLVELDTDGAFQTALVRLSLARTLVEQSVFDSLVTGLTTTDRDVILACLCESVQGRVALHPLVRHYVVHRARDQKRWEMNRQWTIVPDDRRATHRQLQVVYGMNSSLRYQLESLHHEVLADLTAVPKDDRRLHDDIQLIEIGRTLSYIFGEHRRAAEIFRLALKFNPNRAYSHHYLAFNLDWQATQPAEVEEHYKKATELQDRHPWWWSRWITYLATRGEVQEARRQWREAHDALSIGPDSRRWIFMSLHRWVARWLLHWGDLDFAEEVLREIPDEYIDPSIQAEWDLLKALREADRGAAVFPLSVPAAKWWWAPHTNLPQRINGDHLQSWMPGRVEAIDRDNERVYFLAAHRPETLEAPTEFEEIRLPWEKVTSAAYKFRKIELKAGSYVEFGYYGRRRLMRIGLHRDVTWNDDRLLPLVPPPDRWYDRAVKNSWNSMRNERPA